MNQSILKESKLPDASERAQAQEILTGAIPTGHIPKPKVIADYIMLVLFSVYYRANEYI